MSKRENRSASGSMELDYEWEETSSGHIESESSVTLSGEGAHVVLTHMSLPPVNRRA